MTRRTRHDRASAPRGFTLIELVIAMAAGVVVGLAAMILSRNATRFFQHEARITAAQLSVTLGMTRLSADLQRAGFLSTPNILKDPALCSDQANWPDGLTALAGIQITPNGSAIAHPGELDQSLDALNGFAPDSVVIGGAFSTTEQFPVRLIQAGGNGVVVYLQTDTAPMARTLVAAQNGAPGIPQIFAPGRFLRILDAEGRQEWGVISAVNDADLKDIQIALEPAPAIPFQPASSCGVLGMCTGCLVNPVSRVRYDLRSLAAHPNLGVLVAPPGDALAAALSGDVGRTELVRVELDAQGDEIANTLELVAEYAVDLTFGVSATTPVNGPNPAVTRFPMNDPAGYLLAGDTGVAGSAPHRVRGLSVRFSTRARAPDRDSALPIGAGTPVGQVGRFHINSVPVGVQERWARMRTLESEVMLPNQAGVQWN